MTNKKKMNRANGNKNEKNSLLLKNMSKENPFQVPDKFFESQRLKILDRIEQEKKEESKEKKNSSLINFRYAIGIAGIAATVLLFISLFRSGNEENLELYQDITLEQLMEEAPELLYSMDENEIVDILFSESDFSVHEVFSNETLLDSDTYEEGIMDYLIEEEISTELLYN